VAVLGVQEARAEAAAKVVACFKNARLDIANFLILSSIRNPIRWFLNLPEFPAADDIWRKGQGMPNRSVQAIEII
jgi:hypothetical protein